MDKIRVFLDSDVLVSALLSSRGASFEILQNSGIEKIISAAIKKEVIEVAKRLNIDKPSDNIFRNLKIVKLKLEKARISEIFISYVFDEKDSHVIAGAHKAKARFLLTHNLKHYRVEKIKNSLDIIVMKPGIFLQYLRSQ